MLVLNLSKETAVLETSDGPIRVVLLERGRVGIKAPDDVLIGREKLPERDAALPTLGELRGIAPESVPDGMTAAEYVRSLRD